MPTYTYRCDSCSRELEVFQSMSDPPLDRCPECGGRVRRTFHPVGIVLKGSGFHKTDYRSRKSPSGPDGGRKQEGGTESSPDAAGSKDAPSPKPSSTTSSSSDD